MLTTTKEKHILIHTDLIKTRFKSAILTLLKVATFILSFAGIVLIVGTAGRSDLEPMAFSETITRVLKGVSLCGIAWGLNFIKLVIE